MSRIQSVTIKFEALTVGAKSMSPVDTEVGFFSFYIPTLPLCITTQVFLLNQVI